MSNFTDFSPGPCPLPASPRTGAARGGDRDLRSMTKKAQDPAVKHAWAFEARFRRHAFGWRSQPAIARVRQAISEIKKVARRGPSLAGEGAVAFLARFAPLEPHARTPARSNSLRRKPARRRRPGVRRSSSRAASPRSGRFQDGRPRCVRSPLRGYRGAHPACPRGSPHSAVRRRSGT